MLFQPAEDCDDLGHVQGKLLMLFQPAEDCEDLGHVQGELLMLFQLQVLPSIQEKAAHLN